MDSVRIVSDEELMFTREVTQRIERGGSRGVVELADGCRISSESIGVVFNRLRVIDRRHLDSFGAADRDYAASEAHAVWLSWLAGLPCAVLNPATPRGLCGPELSAAEWMQLAARAGLAVPSWGVSTWIRRPRIAPVPSGASGPERVTGLDGRSAEPRVRVEPLGSEVRVSTVIGTQIVGAFANERKEGLVELARSVGCSLIEVHWRPRARRRSRTRDEWCVSGVSAVPECANDAIVEPLSRLLARRARTMRSR
jgi:hypothetical protein